MSPTIPSPASARQPLRLGKGHILWVLYLGYLWLIVGLPMTAAATTSMLALSVPTHAFTAGAIGTMIIGMVSGVSLCHTGRAIEAARPTVVSFCSVTLAAAMCVFVPIVAPEYFLTAVKLSGGLWAVAFALLLVVYAPILTAPRADGRPG